MNLGFIGLRKRTTVSNSTPSTQKWIYSTITCFVLLISILMLWCGHYVNRPLGKLVVSISLFIVFSTCTISYTLLLLYHKVVFLKHFTLLPTSKKLPLPCTFKKLPTWIKMFKLGLVYMQLLNYCSCAFSACICLPHPIFVYI